MIQKLIHKKPVYITLFLDTGGGTEIKKGKKEGLRSWQ